MTASNFDRALSLVLKHEGGYVNDPRDNGGATNKGVTQYTYDAYRRSLKLSARTVRAITDGEVAAIYRLRYWNAVRGDELPPGLDYCIFDFGVNSGPRRAIEFLQRACGVDDDGVIGPKTLAAVGKVDVRTTIGVICARRLSWLQTLSDWRHFGKGWSNRVAGVRREALAMAVGLPPLAATPPVPVEPAPSTVTMETGDEARPEPPQPGFWARLAAFFARLFAPRT